MSIIYNESTREYDDSTIEYGGFKDVYEVKNDSVVSVKPESQLVTDVKATNVLIDRDTETQTYYQRIHAGMPMGLLLSITYPVDQDGEARS